MDVKDLYWAAGFLEAEGCFQTTGVTPTISASQCQRQLLDRLSMLFGGRVSFYLRKPPDKDIYVWAIHDHRAIGIMLTLFSILSPPRQKSINNSVENWRRHHNNHNRYKSQCKNGHLLSGDNLYNQPDGRRVCRICKRARLRCYRAKKKFEKVEQINGNQRVMLGSWIS